MLVSFGLAALFSSLPVSAHASGSYGKPEDPLTATVLDTEVRTGDPEEMRYVILSNLTERYALEQDITVSQAEIDAYVESLRRVAEHHREQNEKRRAQLMLRLEGKDLTAAERKSLSAQLDSLNRLMESLGEGEKGSEAQPQEERKARELVAAAFIRQWKINRDLYRQYGGRIVYQQGGPEPLDACRRFLEEQEKRGAFTILDRALADKFWDYYRNDARHEFYPPGSREEAQAFETPWWLMDMTRDGS